MCHTQKKEQRFNTKCAVVGEGLWGIGLALVAPATVLTVLLRQCGAGKAMVGSISAIEGGGSLLPQLIGLYIFTSVRKRKRQLLLWHLLWLIPCLLLPGAVLLVGKGLSPALLRWCTLMCYLAFVVGGGIVTAAWMDWMAHLFPVNTRGKAIGLAWGASFLAGTGGAIVAGRLIRSAADTAIFGWLYLSAGMLLTLSITTFWLVKDPATHETQDTARLGTRDLLARFSHSLWDRNFRAFLIGRILATSGFCIVPFIAVYYTSPVGGGLNNGTIVSLGAAMTLGTAAAMYALGWIGDRFGHRAGILCGAAAQVATLTVMLSSSGAASCAAAYAMAGIVIGSAFISHFNMMFETCPHDHRMAHITVGNMVLGVNVIIMPLLAGVAAERWGERPVFWVCLALSSLALLWFLARVREPRTISLGPSE